MPHALDHVHTYSQSSIDVILGVDVILGALRSSSRNIIHLLVNEGRTQGIPYCSITRIVRVQYYTLSRLRVRYTPPLVKRADL